MKRSVSPQTVLETSAEPTTKRRRFFGLFSGLKTPFSTSKPVQPPPQADASNNEIMEDPFPNTFTSRKRQHSVHENLKHLNQSVPRSSSVGGNLSRYQAISETLRSEKVAINGDTEQRRMSVVAESAANMQGFDRDLSPSLNIPRDSILPANIDMDIDENELPLVIEHEFAPLYRDGSGNLVRPPFINLDPRERYNLLQLKKSVEASEFLHNRLKFMVDPDETTSIIKPNNKVESSTQTHDKEFLNRTMNFTLLKSKLASNSKRYRRSKAGPGFFSGEFSYDTAKAQPVTPADPQLAGYLGTISKPEFIKAQTNDGPKKLPDDDSQTSSRSRRSVGERAGLEEALRSGKAAEMTVDQDYLDKTEKLSSIIKVKGLASDNKKLLGPSSGFNFGINKDSIGSIIKKRKEDDELVLKSSAPNFKSPEKSGFFGISTEKSLVDTSEQPLVKLSSKPMPAFSFGNAKSDTTQVDSKALESKENVLPKFNFGAKKAPEPSSTPITFGASKEKPSISFGAKPESAKETTPSFSFGPKGSSEPLGSPAFSFGKAKSNEPSLSNVAELPKFSFGSKKDEEKPATTPKFSFGQKNDEAIVPAGEKDAPKPLFGVKNGDLTKVPEASSSISFGEKKQDTPKLTFGTLTEAPKLSFGTTDTKEDATKITFGSTPSATITPSNKRTHGTNDEDKTEEATKKFSFGATTDAPKFSFGAKPAEASSTIFGQTPKTDTKPATEAPKFSFGNKESTPSFSFGQNAAGDAKEATPAFSFSSKESTPKPFLFGSTDAAKPAFSFGAAQPAEAAKPAFSFGKTETPEVPKPAFTFGQTASADPALIFGGSSNAPQPSFGLNTEPTPFKLGAPAQKVGEGFTFGGANSAFGSASRSATPSNPTFNVSAPASSANLTAPTSNFAFGANNSFAGNSTSPFGQNQQMPNPATVFGGNTAQPAPFTFGGAGAPFSAPGSFGLASRENTPPVFGGQPAINGQAPGQPFTPPLAMQGRKIAHMRNRKRF